MQLLLLCYVATLQVLSMVNSGSAQSGPVDLTLVSDSVGVDVVDACVRKINVLLPHIFENDFGLLKRIAFVESNYGTDEDNMNQLGGIWRITPSIQNFVTSHSDYDTLLDEIMRVEEVSALYHYSIPWWSALTARLYIHFKLNNEAGVPKEVSQQAEWWSTNYNSEENSSTFIDKIENYEDVRSCNSSEALDLFFLVDRSSSLSARGFNSSLAFIRQLSSRFVISPLQVRTGLMLFSNNLQMISLFNQHTSNEAFENAILETPLRPLSGTKAGRALTVVRQRGFTPSTGARPISDGVPRVVVMLTDGKSSDNITEPTRKLKAAGVTIFAVGVGTRVDTKDLNFIASDPDSEYAFLFESFDNLTDIFGDSLSDLTCEVPLSLPNNTDVNLRLIPDTPAFAVVKTSGGDAGDSDVHLTISSNDTNIGGSVYASSRFPRPNSALHDVEIPIETGERMTVLNTSMASGPAELHITIMPTGDGPFTLKVNAIGQQVDAISDTYLRPEISSTASPSQTDQTSQTKEPSQTDQTSQTKEPLQTGEPSTRDINNQNGIEDSATTDPMAQPGTTQGPGYDTQSSNVSTPTIDLLDEMTTPSDSVTNLADGLHLFVCLVLSLVFML